MNKEIKESSIIRVIAIIVSVLAPFFKKENKGSFIIIVSVLAPFFKKESFKEGIYTSFFCNCRIGYFLLS